MLPFLCAAKFFTGHGETAARWFRLLRLLLLLLLLLLLQLLLLLLLLLLSNSL